MFGTTSTRSRLKAGNAPTVWDHTSVGRPALDAGSKLREQNPSNCGQHPPPHGEPVEPCMRSTAVLSFDKLRMRVECGAHVRHEKWPRIKSEEAESECLFHHVAFPALSRDLLRLTPRATPMFELQPPT